MKRNIKGKEFTPVTVGDRIYVLRTTLKLTQADLGNRIGFRANSISDMECGKTTPAERTLRSISRELNINYEWLACGTGPMEKTVSDSLLDQLRDEFTLDDDDLYIVREYISLPRERREHLHFYVKAMLERLKEEADSETSADE